MDIIESIEIINGSIEFGKQKYSDVASEYIEALEQAVEALLKQEPMKPTYDHRYAEMGCSVCGNMMGRGDDKANYCPECGQKIDWED